MTPETSILEIDTSRLVGKGAHREVYRHPTDDGLCVKIMVGDFEKEFRREKKFYQLMKQRDTPLDHLPAYHGEAETSLGTGSVFDLICDDNGEVSKNLEFYLKAIKENDLEFRTIYKPLKDLKQYLYVNEILTTGIVPRNIACQMKDKEIRRCYLVDDVGNSEFFPLCEYSSFFARRKVLRKWGRFEEKLQSALR